MFIVLLIILDSKLNKGKIILGNNFEKLPSNYRDIESEANLLFKEVSDAYSDALDALKSKFLNKWFLISKRHYFDIMYKD